MGYTSPARRIAAFLTAIAVCVIACAAPAARAGTPAPAPDATRLVLSDADASLYARLFAAGARHDTARFNALKTKVADPSLLAIAKTGRIERSVPVWLPQATGQAAQVYQPAPRDKAANEAAQTTALNIQTLLDHGDIQGAYALARSASALDRIETAQAYTQIAAHFLYGNQAAHALPVAHLALQIGGSVTPEAAWIAGLASWKLQDYGRAARYFAWVPRSPYADTWTRSAAAYWCARALMRQGQYQLVSAWLREAARDQRNFYGLIASRALGIRFDFNWVVPPLDASHIATLKRYPGAVRALKLAQVGQTGLARIEMALLDQNAAPQWREAMAALALGTLKPHTVMKLADILQTPNGAPLDMALYPLAPWSPQDGFRIDPALIHAFMRQESAFRPAAYNKGSGATGVLQMLPRTARGLDRRTKGDDLKNPEASLTLGQKYLETLLDMTDGDLFEAAIAYNAGPGNLSQWRQKLAAADGDALLFIETLPYRETRAYVERVMANYWIYSLRMGGGTATLDSIAAGRPALYAAYAPPAPAPVFAAISSK